MGKIDYALNFLAAQRIKTGIYDEMDDEHKQIYMNKLKKDILDELLAKAFQDTILTKFRGYYNKALDEGEADEIIPLMKDINEEKKKREEQIPEKSDYVFITVNPRPDVPLSDFKKAVDKSVQKTFIKKSLHVIEQRGESMDTLGKGFHTHILIDKGDYRISHLKREFARTFGKLTDVSNPCCFNIDFCKKEDIKKRQNYMLGWKKDETKHLKQVHDRPFRKKFLIKDYYGSLFDTDDDVHILSDDDIASFKAGF